HNPMARDFRKEVIGETWSRTVLAPQGDGTYLASLPEPNRGWSAFFVALEFPSGTTYPFRFTTEVSVIPDVLPHQNENVPVPVTNPTALDTYVAAPDANYAYE